MDLVASDPFQCIALDGCRFAADEFTAEELEPDPFAGIIVDDGFYGLQRIYADAEFFFEFALQALRIRFVRQPFAAWKFPKAAEMIPGPSPCDEEFAVAEDQARSYLDDIGLGHRRIPMAPDITVNARCSCR